MTLPVETPSTSAPPLRRAWLLNLDAELELRHPSRYQPTKGTLAACRHFEPFARDLLREGDVLLSRSAPLSPGCAEGYQGMSWCPTPSALSLLERAGARVPAAPSLECLQRVSHRRFHAELGQLLPGAAFADDLAGARALVERPSQAGWMVKRGYGFAGRGNRRFPTTPTSDDWRWLSHAVEDGGVQVEPWLDICGEYSLHGYIFREGSVRFGVPCVQRSFAPPVYARTSGEHELGTPEREALEEQGEYVARALRAAGYYGPFGIDAFRYADAAHRRFNPRSEINPRYTLAYATGLPRH